ncbi:uncharacterized protein LOC128918671 isoform X2 [Rissa tridactyla]|uniref:uncharacterized protein LOC128918671 isoform X2 n=1 Tax=Rissa tridactyla TaxID=75485 RepID=UPI0023BAA05F|nr:uncharacterized protein LOC128918671 isoform X2 [Rissa tridactyla]
MEEIRTIFSFYESSKAKEKEHHKGNWFQGMKPNKGIEATSRKDSLLKELSGHHYHAEQALRQKQWEEIKHSSLSPDLTVPKQTLHFLEEIPHQLSTCLFGLQMPDTNFTEQQMQAKEMQVIQETKGDKFGNLVAYFILSQRHLRQTVIMLQDCYKLKKIALRSQEEGTGLEHLVVEELSTDDDTRDISHLLKESTEYILLVLEFIQTARLLQIREAQFKETVRSLKGCIQEKFVDEANIIASELKKFREQKMRKLEEQLELFLENKRTKKNISSNFDPLQNSMKECSETKASLGKDFHPHLQKLVMRPEEEKKGREMQQNNSPLSSITKSFCVPGIHHKADDQLLLFLTINIKVLKQAEHLMASRIILLNPQFTTPSLQGGDKPKCTNTSFLLGLLRDMNDELQSHAMAAGLLESQGLDKKTASTSQDIQDALMTQEGELTVVDPATLSTREFVIYQYGISILQFLRFHIDAPEINLCIASSIPFSNATGNAFRNSFFYQVCQLHI